MNYLLSFDLLNNHNVSMIDTHSMKKSILGFLFTFVISILFLSLNYSVFVGFFLSQTSLILRNQMKSNLYPERKISDYNILFSLTDQNGYPIDESILNIDLMFTKWDIDNGYSYSHLLKSNNCTNEYNTVRFDALSYLYCVNNITNFTYGYWDIDNITYFSVEVRICDINENPNCKELDKIIDFISNNNIYIVFSLPIMRILDNSKSGINQEMKNKNYLLNDKIYTYKEFFLTENIMKTTGGFFFDDYESKVVSTQTEVNDNQSFQDHHYSKGRIKTMKLDNFNLASFLFFFDREYILYERKIVSIEDIINHFGGITQILIIIINIINSNYSDELFLLRLESFNDNKSNSKKHVELSNLKFLNNYSQDNNYCSKSFDSSLNSKSIICKISNRLDLNLENDSNLYPHFETKSKKKDPKCNNNINNNININQESEKEKKCKHGQEQKQDQEQTNLNIKKDVKSSIHTRISIIEKSKFFEIGAYSDDSKNDKIIEHKLNDNANSKHQYFYIDEFEYLKYKVTKILRFITCKNFIHDNYEKHKYLIKKNASKLSIHNYFQLLYDKKEASLNSNE